MLQITLSQHSRGLSSIGEKATILNNTKQRLLPWFLKECKVSDLMSQGTTVTTLSFPGGCSDPAACPPLDRSANSPEYVTGAGGSRDSLSRQKLK